jgi:hypothetical protein
VLSLQERGQLLLVVVILILIGAIFLGTAGLIDRIFPGTPPSVDFWYFSGNQNLSPGAAVFASLTMICAILAVTIFGTALFSTLAFLYIPLILMCVIGIGLFFTSFLGAFSEGGFVYGIVVLGIFGAQAAVISWVIIKIGNWYDSRFGNNSYSSITERFSRNEYDFLLNDIIDKHR